ncbi:hypothetical protein Emag_005876 [Eimeria magna]
MFHYFSATNRAPHTCPPYVLYSRTAFRRLGPPDLDRTFASPTLWEGPQFADFRGFSRESVFAVLAGPGWVMQSGEPCWVVVCFLRDVHREMIYDRAMREIFPRHRLRRFVEIPPRMCPRNMDIEYSYAVAPSRVEPEVQLVLIITDFICAFGWFDALLVFWIPMDHGIRDSLAAGLLTITISTPSTPSGRSPAYEPLGILAPSVTSSVLSEEDRERGSQDEEPDPPSPVISSASTPSTSVGGSPPGNTTPRHAPEEPGPPHRRRRLEPHSALFPETPEPVDEVQSPSAPANDNSAGAGADPSADASHSTSH